MRDRDRRFGAAFIAGISLAGLALWTVGAGHSRGPASGSVPASETGPDAHAVRFGRDIRPLLSDRCFKCHGPDANTRAAELRLDERASATALRDGAAPIVPGDSEASEILRRMTSTDPEMVMPPPDSNKRPLSKEEISLVRAWIDAGAEYEPHWAFVPPRKSAAPSVRNEQWCRGEIDRFVLASLEAGNIEPSPEADRATLLRRLFLDLTGLPPSPAELDEFLRDESPDAYERWVERLLTAEPYRTRYAENMTVPWLDQARYADTCGIHMDAGRQIWPWRDWVLRAYRDNMPFDRFVVEQIAGDLIAGGSEEEQVQRKIASGFNRNHVTTDEGGAIDEEYKVEYVVDRVATTGSVFLGMTVGCARCHDHKFDPVTMEDFYSLYAFFNSIEEPGLYSQTQDVDRAHEPFLEVPTPEQKARRAELAGAIASLKGSLEQRTPEEEEQRRQFFSDLERESGVAWAAVQTVAAASTGGSTLTVQPDGSVLASGENPKKDEYEITCRLEGTGENELRLISLEVLTDESVKGKIGRFSNGNAVVTGVRVEAVSVADPLRRKELKFGWVWANITQTDGDFDIATLPDNDEKRGWALAGHQKPGGRVALLMADEPFGYEGGTELRVKVRCASIYEYHNVARVRIGAAAINDPGLARLPSTAGHWYVTGPFPSQEPPAQMYEKGFGPEEGTRLDFARNFGFGNQYWRFDGSLVDERTVALAAGRNVFCVGRTIFSPTARELAVSLGSDDGFRLFVNGEVAAERRTERGVMPDQDKATIRLRPGPNTVVLKIVNTGGPAGYYWRSIPGEDELTGDLAAGILAPAMLDDETETRLERSWRVKFLPRYRETERAIAATQKELDDLNAKVPRTMVMKELEKPRETFVLTRGQYDHADKSRPVPREVPKFLGTLPPEAPKDRLGLATWLVSPDNPLLARVAVNRLWEQFFGTGIVATTEDFGYQGEWPSHPELLDRLAVEFRESGWDVKAMVTRIVTSATYRQSSRVRPELRDRDPGNRLLAYFPRRRLTAEQTRDQALYVSGLLVEKMGGPSVKPYQPDGLWKEVAMIQSNTREFKRGEGEDLYRRSMYTYWKRAAPPPSMLTFDAPTREFCTIRRASTSTPLQALVLWNDEQFAEAARKLAERTLLEPGDDAKRLESLMKRCASRAPEAKEREALLEALAAFRERYRDAPADAEAMLQRGEAPISDKVEKSELAAWTMVASAVMNLYEVTTQH